MSIYFKDLTDSELKKLRKVFTTLAKKQALNPGARAAFACVNEVDVHLANRNLLNPLTGKFK